jgi:large subunit ribosomal protein L2
MKTYKPTTPGRRGMSVVTYRGVITTNEPHKGLTRGVQRDVGRNNQGRITTRHKGSGHKRLFRDVDFVYDKKDIPAKVATVEYDPNRTGFIALVVYADGEKRYVLLPQTVKVGDTILVSETAPIKPGNRLPLKNIPVGTYVYNVEIKANGGAKLIRSAGTYAEVIAHDEGYAQLKMPSTEVRKVLDAAWATVGSVSNDEHYLVNLGKAGRNRWKGVRPTTRGSAMNPVDHPHGGGEGRQGIGLRRGPKTREGKLAYGVKTRKPKKYSNIFIVSRRKTKRNK